MSRPPHNPDLPGCDCFGCHIRGVQFSPACTPTRRNTIPPRTPNNSWERGVPTDNRGMPYLDSNLNEIGQKTFAANRSTIETKVRELRNAPAPTPSQ